MLWPSGQKFFEIRREIQPPDDVSISLYPDLVAEVAGLANPKKQALAHLEIEYEYRSRKVPRLGNYNRVLTLGSGLTVHTARILEASGLDDERRFKLLNFVRTYVKLDDTVAPEYEALLRKAQNQEVREMVMTWADELKAEGEAKGRQEGEAKGRQEGEAKGRQEGVAKLQNLVMDLMSQRFGRLSKRTRRQIAAITSLDELAELAKKVFKVHSPEELLVN